MDQRTKTAAKAWTMAVLYGIGGNLLLFFFLCTLLPFSEALKFVPWAVAFTGAASGYTFLDRTGAGRPTHRYGWSAAGGAAVGVLTWVLINTGARFVSGLGTVAFAYLLLFAGVCTLCSLLGAALAIKSQRLNAANR